MLLILFMYIFSFPMFKTISSTGSNFIIGGILFLYFLINNKYRDIVLSTLRKKYVIKIMVVLTIVLIYSFIVPTILGTKDYSILKNFISQYFILFIGVLIYGIYSLKGKVHLMPIHIVYVFIIQSFIQIISLVLPIVNSFLNNFRTESAINLGQIGFYGGTRGLAISGQAFFGLGVGYGLVFIMFLDHWEKIAPKIPLLKFLYLSMLIFGAISAARTSLVGLVIGIIFLIVKKIWIEKEINNLKKNYIGNKILFILFILPFVLLLLIFIIITVSKNQEILAVWNNFLDFALEFLKGFTTSGELTTNSTDILFGRMYFPITETRTLIIGDGYYTSATGSYYMNTDAGYMRNILYSGVVGLLLLLIYQLYYFDWKNNNNRLLNFSCYVYILVIHIKGEALGFSTMLISLLILQLLYQKDLNLERKKLELIRSI